MKNLLLVFVLALLFTSCRKAPGAEYVPRREISADIQNVIGNREIDRVVVCCIECQCNVSYDDEGDYEFEGSNFIQVNSISYNLNNLHSYEVTTAGGTGSGGSGVTFLILYFPL
jgi:hypothetical protein